MSVTEGILGFSVRLGGGMAFKHSRFDDVAFFVDVRKREGFATRKLKMEE
jgi:hypothetical protein